MAEAWYQLGMALDYTVESSPSPYAAWVSGTTYRRGDRVFSDPDDGGNGNNYELTVYVLTSTTRPENQPAYWLNLGSQQVEVLSYNTTAQESLFTTWTSGTAVLAGEIQYDPQAKKDYSANIDISSGDNTVRPSVAVQSNDIELAARWTEVGPANAFAMLDNEINTPTLFIGEMTAVVRAYGRANRLAFFGLNKATSITVSISGGNLFVDPTFANSNLSQWSTFVTTLTHLNPGLRIDSNSVSDGTHSAYTNLYNLIPGVEYTFSAVANGTASGSPSGWKLTVQEFDQSFTAASSTVTGNTSVSVTFTATTTTHILSLALGSGTTRLDVSSISIKQDFSAAPINVDLEFGTSGAYRKRKKIVHDLVADPIYTITVTGGDGEVVDVGLISIGGANDFGPTQSEVRAGSQQYHDIKTDEYGNAKFIQRGSQRELTATIFLEAGDPWPDMVSGVMTELEGKPATFDLNNTGTEIERLLVHGWAEDWYTVVTGIEGNDYLVISPLRSLVEPNAIPQRWSLVVQ
jgi:hypothetical protein